MTRFAPLTTFLFLTVSISAFGQGVDPTGFCPPPGSVAACTTGTGLGGETIGIGTTSFVMEKNGNGTSTIDWYLLVAVPNDTGGAPTITSHGGTFTQVGTTKDEGQFLPTTSGDIYNFSGGLSGDSSMRASNMFGANEAAAFGSTPTSFEIFEYEFTSSFGSNIPYLFDVGGSGLEKGTFLAGWGGGNQGFSTPFTTTGLASCTGSACSGGGGGGGGQGGQVPEPLSIVLLGTISLFTVTAYKRKTRIN